jgi:hypothetical protein
MAWRGFSQTHVTKGRNTMPLYREAFDRWVGDGQPEGATVVTPTDCVAMPVQMLLNSMTESSDILPSALCDELDIERGSSYGEAARRLLREGA